MVEEATKEKEGYSIVQYIVVSVPKIVWIRAATVTAKDSTDLSHNCAVTTWFIVVSAPRLYGFEPQL